MPGFEYIHTDGTGIKAWRKGVTIDDNTITQARNLSGLPFVRGPVALMPDAHWGVGTSIGTVFATDGAVIPASVGVDIGCGMMAVPTDLEASDLPDNLSALRAEIESAVPHGRTHQGGPEDRGAWSQPPHLVEHEFSIPQADGPSLAHGLRSITEKHPKLRRVESRALTHLGTLGTGNHFIEVNLDESDRVWVMLHSGSRGPGNAIGRYFIELAKGEMKRWFVHIPDRDLSYLAEGSRHFNDYIESVSWAQAYAWTNRRIMMRNTLDAIGRVVRPDDPGLAHRASEPSAVNCHHNYVTREHHFGRNVWLTRKGAVRARKGDLGIIPGSMGARSYIVRGKGCADSFHSCSHGAGRAMSRNEARRLFSVADHEEATRGVECRKDEGVLDETPAAYKPIAAIMDAQSDLIEVVHTLTPVLSVKG